METQNSSLRSQTRAFLWFRKLGTIQLIFRENMKMN